MDTSVIRAQSARRGARTRNGLTETKLRELVPGERAFKVSEPPRVSRRPGGFSQAATEVA